MIKLNIIDYSTGTEKVKKMFLQIISHTNI